MNRNAKYCLIALLFAALLVVLCVVSFSEVKPCNDPLRIVFVPGFGTEEAEPEEYKNLVEGIFPNDKIEICTWRSNTVSWGEAKKNAEAEADKLLKELLLMTDAERERVVLVGHSLGGKVVIDTLASLKDFNKSVRRAIFIGAAVPDNYPNLEKAIAATDCPCINVCNNRDYALTLLYSSGFGDENECALGAYGAFVRRPSLQLLEFHIEEELEDGVIDKFLGYIKSNPIKLLNHSSEKYLALLKEIHNNEELKDVIFPSMHWKRGTRALPVWITSEKVGDWKIQRHCITQQMKIVRPDGAAVAVGNAAEVRPQFDKLVGELQEAEWFNSLEIQVPQDEKMTPGKEYELSPVWRTKKREGNWKLQKHLMLDKWRILDNRDFIRASGKEEAMRDAFQNVQEQLKH